MYLAFENKNSFSCKINESLISEYRDTIDGVSTVNTDIDVYWEAAVYFDNDDFTLKAFTQRANEVKEIEVLKFPLKKINEVKIFEVTYGTLRSIFKIDLIVGLALGIIVFLYMLIHPEPGYSDIGFVIFISLFLGIGVTLLLFFIQNIHSSPPKNICINLITCDKRVITLFSDTEQKDWIIEILSKYFVEVKDKGLPFWEINLN